MGSLILLRHGQSQWNHSNRFTGWVDVDLTRQGVKEAKTAGYFMRDAELSFDIAFTSLLKRAIRTLWVVLDTIDQMWLPVEKSWRLNERHYGALQGLDKAEIADRYGKKQVFLWRRSFDVRPPAYEIDDPRHPRSDARYAHVDANLLPGTESLKDTLLRVLPLWETEIIPRVTAGQRVLVVAHGNSLRALVKHLDGIADQDVAALNIPHGIPIYYQLDERGMALHRELIGDPDVVRAAEEAAARASKVNGTAE
jgi:2,3-bisphosphoglycerate-dependent phosphoglycerate mutase